MALGLNEPISVQVRHYKYSMGNNRKIRVSITSVMVSFFKRLRQDTPNIIFFVAFILVNIIVFAVDYAKYLRYKEFFYLRVFLGHFLPLARASAACLKLNSALVLIPICRNCLLYLRSFLSNCPEPFGRSSRRLLDRHVVHHKWIARSILFFTLLHVGAHTFNVELLCQARVSANATLLALSAFPLNFPIEASEHHLYYVNPIRVPTAPYSVLFTTVPGATGTLLTVVLILIWTSAFRVVRVYAFEAFWFTHHLFPIFFIAFGFHGTSGFIRAQINVESHDPEICVNQIRDWGDVAACPLPVFQAASSTAWHWIVGPVCLYVLERVVKLIRTRHPFRISKVVFHPSKVVELQLLPSVGAKPGVAPGQYIALQCPELSRLEWHPFTLTSTPNDDFMSVHIRAVGDWTSGLHDKCKCQDSNDANPTPAPLPELPIIYVDGPFGAASEEWFAYETAVFVGAGIGVTPFASILKHMFNKRDIWRDLYVKSIHFFWITPDLKAFEWFRDMLRDLERCGGDLLTYHIFLTRGWDPKRANSIARHHQEEQYDEFSNLETRTQFGRPNWVKELSNIAAKSGDARVGVFLCGPKPLAKELKQACVEVNDGLDTGPRLYFNKEHF